MRTLTISTISLQCFALVLVAACGDRPRAAPDAGPDSDAAERRPDARPPDAPPPDAPPPDAPPPDAPPPDAPPVDPPASLERVDWRTTRGAPIATTAVTLPTTELFSLSGGSFVTRSDCQNAPGCTFTWRDLAGTAAVQRDHLSRVTSVAISPDGGRAQLVALDALENCNDGQGIFQVARGTLQLLDLATGAADFGLTLRSNIWSTQGFTPTGDWFFVSPIQGTTACASTTTGFLSAASPFAPPPGLGATDQFVQAVTPRRWLVQRSGGALGIADPLTSGSFLSLSGTDPDPFFDVTQGWLHVYLGFADLVQNVVSIPPTGPMRQLTLASDEDWHSFGARGRWIRVCGLPQADSYRDCRVVDAQGEVAPANFRITFALSRSDDAVLLDSGSIVFVGPTDSGSPAVQRLEFATGQREILHAGDGTLRPLGDGRAALLLQNGSTWLIEAAHEELVAQNVSQLVIAPSLLARALGRSAGRQDDLAALVSSSGTGQFTLALLDARTRRLATVTDALYFTPPPGSPLAFSFGDGCGQPWTTRNGGTVIEGFFQQPQQLFFVEQGAPATLWVVPVDLSAPPRRLAQLAGDPAACHAPLASPDGRRLGVAENGADGITTRITLSTGP